MTKPYSLDLGDRAVARVVAGETVRSVAAALRVAVASVVKWPQRFRATGSAAPRKMGGQFSPVLPAYSPDPNPIDPSPGSAGLRQAETFHAKSR